MESEFVSKRHILLDFRHVVSFLHACLKFSGIESDFLCDIFAFVRTDGFSLLLFFESVHFLGEFLVLTLRCRTECCERVFRSVLVYIKWVHAVFQTNFSYICVFRKELTAHNFLELYAGGTLKIRKDRYLDFRVLVAEKRAFDFFIQEYRRILR